MSDERTWSSNEAIEFTQDLEKPGDCMCAFPDEVLSGLTGHRPGCPVFVSWAKRLGMATYISVEEAEQVMRLGFGRYSATGAASGIEAADVIF